MSEPGQHGTDLPGFILDVTREVWEGRRVESLRRYYTPEIPVRSPDGAIIGNEAAIGATHATLAEFPDRQLLGEDVIWCGNETDGFYSSHRIYSTATHTGAGLFGPPTGTALGYRVIADCAVRGNQMYDEWIVRDLGAIVRQLGIDPERFAADQIEAEGGPDQAQRPLMTQDDPPPVHTGTGNDHPLGERYAAVLTQVLTGDGAGLDELYDRAVQLEAPGGRTQRGWGEVERFWTELRESFPSARLEIHHRIGRDDPGLGARASLRWSLTGTHSGPGPFGPPTGTTVHMMGISHAELGPWGVRREYVLVDEVAIWKQILLGT